MFDKHSDKSYVNHLKHLLEGLVESRSACAAPETELSSLEKAESLQRYTAAIAALDIALDEAHRSDVKGYLSLLKTR